MPLPQPDPPLPDELERPSPPPRPATSLAAALQFGALTGSAGLVAGGVTAVVRSSPTVGLFSAAMGLQSFAMGSTYWAIRSSTMAVMWDPRKPRVLTPREKLYVSAGSGALTGASLGLLFRGPGHVLPGALVWGAIGAAGQYAYEAVDARHTERMQAGEPDAGSPAKPRFMDRVFRSEWSPVKRLTDDEYRHMLREKLLVIEAELAVTDEEIKELEVQRGVDAKQQRRDEDA